MCIILVAAYFDENILLTWLLSSSRRPAESSASFARTSWRPRRPASRRAPFRPSRLSRSPRCRTSRTDWKPCRSWRPRVSDREPVTLCWAPGAFHCHRAWATTSRRRTWTTTVDTVLYRANENNNYAITRTAGFPNRFWPVTSYRCDHRHEPAADVCCCCCCCYYRGLVLSGGETMTKAKVLQRSWLPMSFGESSPSVCFSGWNRW